MKTKAYTINLFVIIITILIVSAIWFYATLPAISQGQRMIQVLLNSTPTTKDRMVITKTFTVQRSFIGYILANKSNPNIPIGILYTDYDGTYLVNPTQVLLMTQDGKQKLQTDQSLYQYGFEKYLETKEARQAYDHIQKTHFITQGEDSAPHKLWIVVDPNCTYCHKIYEDLQPSISSGQVQARWVVVGFLKPSSAPKATAILTAKDPLAALQTNEATFNNDTEEGGIQPEQQPHSETNQQLETNMAFAKQLSRLATPTIIYRNTAGVAQMMQGSPKDATALAQLITSASNHF